ncbi:MarR family winged helix-turn-helix transcriptional regulator [Candidatus Trichorickettsia mobilis]|uniref:MarR family winged helix-turn-helix transcriptional regulator n=1 Tax=Candidatus Trichorickettsia mobilis TaxID=1346319 RepID=UPI00292E364C|nr:MarR family transcriptional regulator [Candidatus Trichorickettsia mobilis]
MKKDSNWINMTDMSGFLLYQTYFSWKRKIESTLLPHELTHVQFILLMSLGFMMREGSEVTQNDLSRFTSFDVTMTSQVLRLLEKRGFIKRSQKIGDERSKFPKLTTEGINKIKTASADLMEAEKCFFECLKGQKQEFDTFLRRILKHQVVVV